MHIYPLKKMLEMIADMPQEKLNKSVDCLRFLEISKKEIQTEEEKKFIDACYEEANKHWKKRDYLFSLVKEAGFAELIS